MWGHWLWKTKLKSCINISYSVMDVVWCASKDHSCQTFNVNSIDLLKDKQMEKTLDKELLVHMAKNFP